MQNILGVAVTALTLPILTAVMAAMPNPDRMEPPQIVMEQARKVPGNWCAGRVTSEYDNLFREATARYDSATDWCDLKAQCMQESSLRPHVTSHAGAVGLCQILPTTGHWLGVADVRDPEQNILGAAKYLLYFEEQWYASRSTQCRERLKRCSYNAGLGTCLKAQRAANGAPCWGEIGPYTPHETQDYIVKIEAITARWKGI